MTVVAGEVEDWGPIKKVSVDDEDRVPGGAGLKGGWLFSVPEVTEVVEPGVGGTPDTAKFNSLVAIQLAPDPTSTPFT